MIGTPLRSIFDNRGLIWLLAKRDVAARYRGSRLGVVWAILQPLMMLAVYSFVFGKIFPARWGSEAGESRFVAMLLCGMLVHAILAECINRAPGVIVSQPGYVKKVVFPLEILPIVPLCSAMFNAGLTLLVLLVLVLVQSAAVPPTAPLFVPIILAFLLFVVGLNWLFAALGVYIRDIGQVTGVVTMILLFLSPVFYSVEALPAQYRYLMRLNPLTFVIEESRKVLLLGELPDFTGLAVYACFGAAVAAVGLACFQKSRRGFADVI